MDLKKLSGIEECIRDAWSINKIWPIYRSTWIQRFHSSEVQALVMFPWLLNNSVNSHGKYVRWSLHVGVTQWKWRYQEKLVNCRAVPFDTWNCGRTIQRALTGALPSPPPPSCPRDWTHPKTSTARTCMPTMAVLMQLSFLMKETYLYLVGIILAEYVQLQAPESS